MSCSSGPVILLRTTVHLQSTLLSVEKSPAVSLISQPWTLHPSSDPIALIMQE